MHSKIDLKLKKVSSLQCDIQAKLQRWISFYLYINHKSYIFCYREIASNIAKLQKENITHVLNCAQGTKFNQINTSASYLKSAGIQSHGIKANAIITFKMAPEFTKAAEFLENALKTKGNYHWIMCYIILYWYNIVS